MAKESIIILTLILSAFTCTSHAQSAFFKQYWAEYNSSINNTNQTGRDERPRVGDRGMSTSPEYWSRTEAQVNGLVMINIQDTIRHFDRAEVYLEMWGGHPGTENKRFQINGGKIYKIPDQQTADNNCEYIYPLLPIDYTELVSGNNAFQFGCDRGISFWGHYIIDQLAIRCYLDLNNSFLKTSKLIDFVAKPEINKKPLEDEVIISLSYPAWFNDQITAVHYFGRYAGYDINGSGKDNDWHGYTHDRKYENHIGTVTDPPFWIAWNTRMIPDQPEAMAIKALIEFKNGVFCWSETLDGLAFPLNRKRVQIFYCNDIPRPFWSRAGQLKKAVIELPGDFSRIENVELHTRIWDGGEGEVQEPFKINGVPYKITTGKAVHDIVYTVNNVDPKTLKPGSNEIELLSDTEHHGIEVCWPGPAIIIKYK
jgi:hypothetical protein